MSGSTAICYANIQIWCNYLYSIDFWWFCFSIQVCVWFFLLFSSKTHVCQFFKLINNQGKPLNEVQISRAYRSIFAVKTHSIRATDDCCCFLVEMSFFFRAINLSQGFLSILFIYVSKLHFATVPQMRTIIH